MIIPIILTAFLLPVLIKFILGDRLMSEDHEALPEFKPSDLAAWSAGYIVERIREKAGIEAVIVTYSDQRTGEVITYTINGIITIGYGHYGMTMMLNVFELNAAYSHETLDEYADRFIANYQSYQERLLGE